MRNSILLYFFAFIAAAMLVNVRTGIAQSPSGHIRCYTSENEVHRHAGNPRFSNNTFENWLAPLIQKKKDAMASQFTVDNVYTIPIVVHVVHNGEAVGTGRNISDAQVLSQVTVLNQDFRRMVGTPGHNTNPVGADTRIEFCMAQRRPDGTAFNGINRVARSAMGLPGTAALSTTQINSTVKPYTSAVAGDPVRGFNPNEYFNVWVCDISGSILGYAQFPETTLPGMSDGNACGETANTDGVVCLYTSWGSIDIVTTPQLTAGAPYNKGRTMTHEIGHWAGLRHIWGDGDCTVDDFCQDTPWSDAANYNCLTSHVSCGTIDMVQNYMDYSDDGCMNIFTQDQSLRMRTVMENSPRRRSLLSSMACIPPNPNDASITEVITPTGDFCNLTFSPVVTLKNFGTSALTSATINYQLDAGAIQTFSWTGSLATGSTVNVTLPAITTTDGVHTFRAYSTLPNGAADPVTTYDESAATFYSGAGRAVPYTEDFESSSFPFPSWRVVNGGGCVTWVGQGVIGPTGAHTVAATVNNYSYDPGVGDVDELYSEVVKLPCNASAAELKFHVAYRKWGTSSNERLRVQISTDCGATWVTTPIYDKSGTTLATVATTSGNVDFQPASAAEWREETVNLMSHVSTTADRSIQLRFMVTNDYGNNVFVDNIRVTATAPVCSISGITAGTQTACVSPANTYTQQVTVTYTNPPCSGGNLVVNGQSFAVTSSPQTVTLTGLTADGAAVNVTASFSANASCTMTVNSLFTAPASCLVTNTITTGAIAPTTYCAGATISVPFSTTGTFGGANVFTAQLSNSAGSFASPIATATGTSPISLTIPGGASTGSGYKVRVIASDPSTTGSEVTITINANPTVSGTTTVCAGATTTLTGSIAGGTWSSSDLAVATVSAGGVVTGVAAGTATITYTVSGCSGTASVTVNAAVTPSVSISASATSICLGSSVTFTATPTNGGTPTYQWKVDGTNVGAPSTSPTFTTTALTNGQVVTVVMTSTASCASPTTATSAGITMTVSATSYTLSASASTVCAGTNVTFTVSPAGATNYEFFIGALSVQSGASNTYSTSGLTNGQVVSAVVTSGGAAATIYTQDFEGVHGWTLNESTGLNEAAANAWVVTDDEGGVAPGGCGLALNGNKTLHMTATVDMFGNPVTGLGAAYNAGGLCGVLPCIETNKRSVSPIFSTVGYTGIQLGFAYIANGQAGSDFASVIYSADGGTTWNTLTASITTTLCGGGQGLWTAYSATLPASCDNNANVRVGINWTNNDDGAGTDPSVAVNDVAVTATGGSVSCNAGAITMTVNANPTISGTTTVCTGATTNLTSSLSGGTWTTSDAAVATVSASGVVTGVAAGTATITHTVSGCPGTATVTVNASPTVSGTNTVCVGGTTTFSGSIAGGTWATSNATIATVDASGVVTGVAAGSATITYTAAGCSGTRVVTVNANPTISGTTTVCTGATTNLTSTLSGGTWTTSDAAVATVSASGVVTGVAAGTATITHTVSGCPGTASVTVNPVPTVSGTNTVCVGATTTFSGSIAGGTWASSNGAVATVDAAGVVTGVAGGSATITYTAGGCSGTRSVTVNANPTISGSTGVCVSATTPLTASIAGGTWSTSDAAVATVNASGVVTGVAGGSATITYTASGCSGTFSITVNTSLTPSVSVTASATTICAGTNVTFTANPTNGGATPTYQWQLNAVNITGATSSSYSSSSLTNLDEITVVMTTSIGCASAPTATSAAVVMTVNPVVTPSVSITAGSAMPVCVGTPVTYTANPTNGGAAPTYQWYVGGVIQAGETASTFTYNAASGNLITVQMTSNAVCPSTATVTSSAFTVTTINVPAIPTVPNKTGCETGTIPNLMAYSTGTNTVNWYSDVALTTLVYTGTSYATGIAVAGVYTYYVTQSNVCGASAPRTVTLTINATCPTGTPPPATPGYLIVDAINDSKLRLRFPDTESNENGYEIYRSLNGSSYTLLTTTAPYSTAECIYYDENLNEDTPYFYIVRSKRGTSHSGFSNSAYDYTYPKAPTLLSITDACLASSGKIEVKGTHNTGRFRWYDLMTTPSNEAYKGTDGNYYELSYFNTPNLQAARTYYVTTRGHRYESQTRLAVTIGIRSLPTALLTIAPKVISCENVYTLTAEAVAGATYRWYNNGVWLGTTTSNSFETSVSGLHHVSVEANGCTAASTFAEIRLNYQPEAKIINGGTASFCKSGVLTAKTVSGASYEWQKDGATVGSTQSVTVSESGTYTLIVTENGCSASKTIEVSVFTFPDLNLSASETSLCPGANTELTATEVAGATRYEWVRNGKTERITSKAKVKTNRTGEYIVRVFVGDNCYEESEVLVIEALDAPKAILALDGMSMSITTSGTVSTVKWYLNGEEQTALADRLSITPSETGRYIAVVTYMSGCSVSTNSNFFVLGTDEEGEKVGELMLYPNPTKSELFIKLPSTESGSVVITDNLGRELLRKDFEATRETKISLAELPVATYFVSVNTNSFSIVKKIVKE